MTRSFIGLLTLVLATGIAALSWATEGFRVITSEGARALVVERHPRPLPDTVFVDQDGEPFSLSDYRGKEVLVDFIYTRCPTICGVLGNDFKGFLERRKESGALAAPALLSISFDAENDTRESLKLYAQRFDAEAPRWRVARPVHRADLDALLHIFGVVVIADGLGGFVHNNAVYLVDARGRLARILGPSAIMRNAASFREAVR